MRVKKKNNALMYFIESTFFVTTEIEEKKITYKIRDSVFSYNSRFSFGSCRFFTTGAYSSVYIRSNSNNVSNIRESHP